MEFIINYNIKTGKGVCPSVISPSKIASPDSERFSIKLIEAREKLVQQRITGERFDFLIFGDLIFPKTIRNIETAKITFLEEHLINRSIHKIKGFFYIIAIDQIANKTEIHSCLFNILPLYYYQKGSTILISTTLKSILNYTDIDLHFSKKYAIEKILFYYSFTDKTIYEEIKLLPACSFFEIGKDGFSITKSFNPYDLYVSNPEPWRISLEKLSDIFLHEFENYIPTEPAAISLTGGFDGRTILSASLKNDYTPETYSYGSPTESDILVPQKIAATLKFRHHPFLLTQEYAQESFFNDGMEFLNKTEFSGNISRAHYVYVAKILSRRFSYLLTGNFGSEILRSMKYPGVMASPSLFALFQTREKKEFEDFVKTDPSLKYLNNNIIGSHLQNVIDEIWDYRQLIPSSLSTNQKFYTYIFGEVFRKYFGPEIVFQSNYIINRSPFLDYEFINELLKTNNAGVYNNFRENNPLSRFHGQVLYSHIIRKAYPALLSITLDKGYKPAAFFSLGGKMMLIFGYLQQNIFKNKAKLDPAYSVSFYERNTSKILNSINSSAFINVEYLKSKITGGTWIEDQTSFVNAFSLDQSYYQKF
jgi:asparagine synthetase B (glutamine-hydrolysing)